MYPARSAEEEAQARDENLYGYGHGEDYRRRIRLIMQFGDKGMQCSFRSDFMTDFRREFGSRINTEELPAPSSYLVITKMLRALTLQLREDGRDAEVLRPIVEYLGLRMPPERNDEWRYWKLPYKYWQDAKGFWSMGIVKDPGEAEQLRNNAADRAPDEAAFREALRRIPKAYACYFDSLTAERSRAIALMDELLALPEAERKPLNAVAKYRRARLRMSLEDWASLGDADVKRRLSSIREDLASVAEHAREGSQDPAEISENTEYWVAYTHAMILPAERLIRLGEADFKGALAVYFRMPIRGQANAVNSSFQMVRKLCAEKAFADCVKDPDLRKVVTFYLSAGGSNNADEFLSQEQAKELSAAWLDTLARASIDPSFDPARIAILQHVAHRWTDCLRTVSLLPTDDPVRLLLASRCNLRLTGDLRISRLLLDPTTSARAAAGLGGAVNTAKPTKADLDFTTLIDFSAKAELSDRVRGEQGFVALCGADFIEALKRFTQGGFSTEADYVAECVLSTDELKGFVDGIRDDQTVGDKPKLEHLRVGLASRLFRDGRMEEALGYLPADLTPKARTYVTLIRLAERSDVADLTRADAYWRASLLISEIGETILHAPFGLSWTSDGAFNKPDSNWYLNYGFLPLLRQNKERPSEFADKHILVAPGQDEIRRIGTWLEGHITHPVRSERDARYAAFDLALKAARHLPDNAPAGGEILQYAGNLLKYRERKAAIPAYVLLVTHFKETTYGQHALEHHWFAKERPSPAADILSQ